VPHFSFAEYDAQIGRTPDLIVIPWFDPDYTPQRDASVLAWIRGHAGASTTLLGICSGNMILADTGLLNGRTATTNTGTFDYVESHAPTTSWLHDVRYVDDGNVVTSSNLTAGIDATLHVVDRFAGRARALEVARQIGYAETRFLDDPRFDPPSDGFRKIGLMAGLEGPRQPTGVLLYDGVTELGMAGLIDPLQGSATARLYVMAPERRIVPSANGFLFVPRYDFASAPTVERVLLPAGDDASAGQQVSAAWSRERSRPAVEDIYGSAGAGGSAYDASLRELARAHNGFLAHAVADTVFYGASAQDFAEARWPVTEALTLLTLVLAGPAAVYGVGRLRRQPVSGVVPPEAERWPTRGKQELHA
jgi:hypothetical protein